MTEIHTAAPADAETCARIQCASWRAAFRGILADDVLEQATEEKRTLEMYRRVLARSAMHGSVLSVDGAPHGIAFWSASRDADTAGFAELVCIHSLPGNWGRGYGTEMMEHVFAELRQAGYGRVMLWVFAANARARRFYEKCGFTLTGRRRRELGVETVQYEREI